MNARAIFLFFHSLESFLKYGIIWEIWFERAIFSATLFPKRSISSERLRNRQNLIFIKIRERKRKSILNFAKPESSAFLKIRETSPSTFRNQVYLFSGNRVLENSLNIFGSFYVSVTSFLRNVHYSFGRYVHLFQKPPWPKNAPPPPRNQHRQIQPC